MRKHNEKMVPTHILGTWSRAAVGPEQFGSPLAAILGGIKHHKRKLQESDGRPHVTTEVRARRFCPDPSMLCLTGEIRVIDAGLLFSL